MQPYFDGLLWKKRNSIAYAMELRFFHTTHQVADFESISFQLKERENQ